MHLKSNHSRSSRPAILVAALCALGAFTVSAQAESWLFDFGQPENTTLGADDPNNTWNNVTNAIGTIDTGSILDLVTTENVSTPVDFFMVSRFNSNNTNGTQVSSLYVSEATRDTLYGNTALFNGSSNVTPIFKLASLDPLLTYSFKFYASRMGAGGDNRETVYTVSGGLSGSAALNASENINGFASVTGIAPDINGEIQISLTPGPNNNNVNGGQPTRFIYLGVMEVEAIPEPATSLALGAGALMLAARRRRSS